MTSTFKSLIFWLGLVVVGVLIWTFAVAPHDENAISFTEFMKKAGHEITEVTISGNKITSKAPLGDPNAKPYYTYFEPNLYEGLANKLEAQNVTITVEPETPSTWATILYSWAPIVLMIGFWIFIMRQMQSGGNKALSFGKSRAKLSSSTQKKVTFKDVAGVDEAKEELQEIIEFLREPQKFQKLGGRIPKGVLLMGAPGTGKNASRARGRRRSERAVLFDQRLGLCRDVRRRRRVACSRPVRTRQEERAVHRVHR